jgi:triphosphoribosyl-dephospho-CoA synthase
VPAVLTSPGLCAQIACLWETTARKPGNVHRSRDFKDTNYLDYALSAAAIAPVLELAPDRRVGQTILDAIRATRQVTRSNTNLGIVLLLTPLASVPMAHPLRRGVQAILDDLDTKDAKEVYEAIRLARPGALGKVDEQDIQEAPTKTLRQVMSLAAERDSVARQYHNGYVEVFDAGVPALQQGLQDTVCLEDAIIYCHLRLMSKYPDSLIARKRGAEEAAEAARLANSVFERGWPKGDDGAKALAELDDWLRAEGHSRNPGTTADLVTASLFVALRDDIIGVPSDRPWAFH